nr:frizzled [Hymenolepis microstoma]
MVSQALILAIFVHLSFCVDIQRGPENPYAETSKCELIRIPACQGLPYNTTILPNIMGHTSQEEAGQDITQYNSLVKIPCSPSLKLFLCSLYFPVCTQLHKPLPPCRSLCEQNRQRCEPIMRSFSFQWPASMQCENFPENGLCVSEAKPDNKETVEATLECPEEMRVPPSFEFRIRLNNKQVIPNCGIPCNRHFFSQSKRIKFSRLWIGLWSGLCAASTLFTILTFFIDINRFQYPERPIIFLSMCYFMVAITYITGLFLGDRISCAGPFPPSGMDTTSSLSSSPLSSSSYPLLITQGTKFEGCTILFMMLYFFSMAGHIWWVVLTITWYLAAKCHWAHEAIFRNAQYLHFAAWAIPAAMTICLLAMGKVDGDPLSGVCFTGLTDPTIVRYFLVAPLCVSLLLGACFLIAGFVSLFKIRTIIKTGGSKTNDLEKLIFRIGVFSLLYLLPAAVVIACYIYESQKMDSWMLTWYTNKVCRNFDPRKIAGSSKCIPQLHQILGDSEQLSKGGSPADVFDKMDTPTFELFMIKYLMTLIVGITSGIWVWSSKTLHSWHVFFARICRCTPPPNPQVNQMVVAQGNRQLQGRSGYGQVKTQQQQALLEATGPGKMPMTEIGGSTNWATRGQPSGAPTNTDNTGGYNWPPSASQTMTYFEHSQLQ